MSQENVKLVGALLAGAAAAVLVAVAVLYVGDYEVVDAGGGDSDLVSVPNVEGQYTYAAEAALVDAGLTVKVNQLGDGGGGIFGNKAKPTFVQTVQTTNPYVGTEVEPDTVVTITVR